MTGVQEMLKGSVTLAPSAGPTMVGAGTMSTVTGSAAEAALVLPALSVSVAVKLWAPPASVPVVKLQAPLALAVALPSKVAPS